MKTYPMKSKQLFILINLFSFLFFFLFLQNQALSQTEKYFQQEVNYKINVTLNDVDHSLIGDIEMEYINNSPDNLSFIYMHLWPNAFKNTKTAFAKQKIEDRSTRFFYGADDSRGMLENLAFEVDGEPATWELDATYEDIAIVRLRKPLLPGEKVILSTPFKLIIPASYSRLGHVGTSYQMTQWYPKPAVYDRDGWHEMPYLDQGEFYSEFGKFDVSITLPKNYVVGATGELQNEEEKAWLETKVAEFKTKDLDGVNKRSDFPESSTEKKTIRYIAENVHDFAWFADKRFYVDKSSVTLASGKEIDTWVMFTDREAMIWKDAINYVNRSVAYYSERVGEYPWPQATAVQSALSAGGGMEYPMITVIGLSGNAESLDEVITHEVGHNWFYGILGSNEREHPWMDEGMNTFYEKEYMTKYYNSSIGLEYILPPFATKLLDADGVELGELGALYQGRLGKDQPISTSSQELTSINYYLNAYDTPAELLDYLRNYIGSESFEKMMQTYYEEWKFKHPSPQDFQALAERETGKDLDFLFQELMEGKKIDYALKGVGNNLITVKNVGEVNGPFTVSGIKDGEVVSTKAFEGFEGTRQLDFSSEGLDNVQIDAEGKIPEINKRNNYQKRKFRFKFLGAVEKPQYKDLYFSPIIGGNAYDKFMLGLAFYNSALPAKKFEFVLAPMFGTGSLDPVGVANFKYNVYPQGAFAERVSVGLGLKSFNYNYIENIDKHEQYYRVSPKVTLELKKKRERQPVQQIIEFQNINLWSQDVAFKRDTIPSMVDPSVDSTIFVFDRYDKNYRLVNSLSYSYINSHVLNPYSVKVGMEHFADLEKAVRDQSYLKASLEATFKYNYKPKKGVAFRLYTAGLLMKAKSNLDTLGSSFGAYPVSLIGQGRTDYNASDYYFGRSEQAGVWAQQMHLNEGGFKTPLPSSSLGTSNSFVIALNTKIDLPLPFNLPIKPYFDIGYFKETRRSVLVSADGVDFADQFMFNGGIAIELGDGVAGIYLPLISSQNLRNELKSKGNFLSQISFTLNLSKANPFKWIKKIRI